MNQLYFMVVGPVGNEPTTHGLKVRCSTDRAKCPTESEPTQRQFWLDMPPNFQPMNS